MKKPLMMIINPAAGKGGYKRALPEALKLLSDSGREVSVFFTESRGHASKLAASCGGRFSELLVLGGDGTLAEAAAGLMELDRSERPVVGYIPVGTANDVARTLGLPKNDVLTAARRFSDGTAHDFDEGKRSGGYFNYVAAFGAFTAVSYATPQSAKQKLGEAAYLLGAARSLDSLRSRRVRVEYDGGVIEGDFMYGSMSNSRSVAGMIELPREGIELGDGLHELILCRRPENAAALAGLAAKVLSHDFSSEYIVIEHTKHARFSFDAPESWTFDGEDGGEHTEIEFENCPQALRLVY